MSTDQQSDLCHCDSQDLACARLCQLWHCHGMAYGMQYSNSCIEKHVLCTHRMQCRCCQQAPQQHHENDGPIELGSEGAQGSLLHVSICTMLPLPCLTELLLCLKHGITPTCIRKCTFPGLNLTCYKHVSNYMLISSGTLTSVQAMTPVIQMQQI